MKRLNYYEVEIVTVCPYCGDTVQIEPHMGCCGEVHSEEVYQDENGETYPIDEVQLYRPIRDIIRYSLNPFSRFVQYKTRIKLNRFKRKLRDVVCNWYDGVYFAGTPYYNETVGVWQKPTVERLILRLRKKTGFQWSKLDCIILRQLHDFPLYYTPPKDGSL